MSNATALIPGGVQLAARRAFLRTTLQGYATSLSGATVTVGGIMSLVETPDPKLIAVTALVALFTPFLAGVSAWLSITYQGIPTDYQPDVPADGKHVA